MNSRSVLCLFLTVGFKTNFFEIYRQLKWSSGLLCEMKGTRDMCWWQSWAAERGWKAWFAPRACLLAQLQEQGPARLKGAAGDGAVRQKSWLRYKLLNLEQVLAARTAERPVLYLEGESSMVFTPFFPNWYAKKEWQWWQPYHGGNASVMVVRRMLKISICNFQWRELHIIHLYIPNVCGQLTQR